jgi:hypothetical protein
VGGAGNSKAQTIQPLGIGYVVLDYAVGGTVKTVSQNKNNFHQANA